MKAHIETYRDRLEARLDEWEEKSSELMAQARKSAASGKTRLIAETEALKQRLQSAREKVAEAGEHATERASERVDRFNEEMEKTWVAIQEAWEFLRNRLKSQEEEE